MASDKIVQITDHDFDKQVIQGKGLILVDFWAEWCGPCRMVAPILDELAEEYGEQVTIAKLNVDENRESAVDSASGAFRLFSSSRMGRR